MDRFADMLIEKIRSMKESNWKMPWVTRGVGMPCNLSGRHYNGINSLLLMMHCEKQGYHIPVFGTFDRIAKLNDVQDEGESLPSVRIKKGEHSFPVFLTIHYAMDKETRERIKWEDFLQLSEEEKERYNIYPKNKVFSVFNVIDQTNLKEARPEMYRLLVEKYGPKEVVETGERFRFAPVDEMVEKQSWLCPIEVKNQSMACYSPSQDIILVPTMEQFPVEDSQKWYGTLFHEMAHSTGGDSRLSRDLSSYGREELVAEMSAAVLCREYGMEKHIKEDSTEYLKSWLDSLQKDPSFLRTTMNDVRKAVFLIETKIDAEEKMQLDKEKQLDQREELAFTSTLDGEDGALAIQETMLMPDTKQGEEEHDDTKREKHEQQKQTQKKARHF